MVPSGIRPPAAGTNEGLPVSIDSPAYTVPSGILVPISGGHAVTGASSLGCWPAATARLIDAQPTAINASLACRLRRKVIFISVGGGTPGWICVQYTPADRAHGPGLALLRSDLPRHLDPLRHRLANRMRPQVGLGEQRQIGRSNRIGECLLGAALWIGGGRQSDAIAASAGDIGGVLNSFIQFLRIGRPAGIQSIRADGNGDGDRAAARRQVPGE